MNIYEAFKAAGPSGKVCREVDGKNFYLQPKDMKESERISLYLNNELLSPNWEPNFKDFVAEDWLVLKKASNK